MKLYRLFQFLRNESRNLPRTFTGGPASAEEFVDTKWHHLPPQMTAWVAKAYGDVSRLQLTKSFSVPVITDIHDVLIKVAAASVNPLDVRMLGGYGSQILNGFRCYYNKSEFPLILGRDFSGIVCETGRGVKRYKPGDHVWGTVAAPFTGTHAEFVLATENSISRKPLALNHGEAASIPYAALSAWAALCTWGNVSPHNAQYIRILIMGGSGGVGTFAIQLMKAWGAEVATTCSSDAIDLVTKLGADHVIDYQDTNWEKKLKELNGFDLILLGVPSVPLHATIKFLKNRNSKTITLNSPLLSNIDAYGWTGGLVRSAIQAGYDTTFGLCNGKQLQWAYSIPNGAALQKIAELVDEGKIIPVIEKMYKLDELPSAYKKMLDGHARGKLVINVL